MKRILFVIFFVFLVNCVSAKSFKASDIIPDDCTNAVMLLVDHRLGNYNKQENYYIDDVVEIRDIFSEWKDLKRMSLFPAHFDSGFNSTFDIHLIIDGKKVPCLIDGISPDGKMIKLKHHGYEYNIEYWERLQSKLKPAKQETIKFSNVSEYRSQLVEIKRDKNYIHSETNLIVRGQSLPDKYDGYFYITTKNHSWSAIEKKISKAYPDDDFIIGGQRGGGLFRSSEFRIYTTKDFYDRFNLLYTKSEFVDFTDLKIIAFFK